MRNYEFTVILDQDDERMKEGLEFVLSAFTKAGVEITKQEDMGVKMLAYQIKKQDKGHYVYFELSADPQKIASLSHDFQLSTLVLKYLFVNPEN